jgi:hypothetical protein
VTARWTITFSSAIAWIICETAFGGSNATCLAKVDPQRDHSPEYLAKVHKLIEPKIQPFLQMRVDPSFDQDHSVCLHGMPGDSFLTEAKHLS